jgi:hypothetical protein
MRAFFLCFMALLLLWRGAVADTMVLPTLPAPHEATHLIALHAHPESATAQSDASSPGSFTPPCHEHVSQASGGTQVALPEQPATAQAHPASHNCAHCDICHSAVQAVTHVSLPVLQALHTTAWSDAQRFVSADAEPGFKPPIA